jgi:hypothetical protein
MINWYRQMLPPKGGLGIIFKGFKSDEDVGPAWSCLLPEAGKPKPKQVSVFVRAVLSVFLACVTLRRDTIGILPILLHRGGKLFDAR